MVGNDFALDGWIVRPQRCCIERGDDIVRVKPKSMAVLECLASAAGNVVSRGELFDSVWPGAMVSDDALTHCVVELRKAFGDTPRDARVIETIPKMGFRLLPQVRYLSASSYDDAIVVADTNPKSVQPQLIWAASAMLSIAVLIVAWHYSQRTVVATQYTHLDDNTLAVLPFVDLSPHQDQEHFTDGLSEELINRLARLNGLQVVGRTSSFFFKNKSENLSDIGRTLRVRHILEGSVRKFDDQLRITAQLIDVSNGYQLWSDTYNRPVDDIFAIQNDISESVAQSLSIELSVGTGVDTLGGTSSVEAYEQLMLGKSMYGDFTSESVLKAIGYFKRATEIDPNYAYAWAALADSYRSARLVLGEKKAKNWSVLAEDALARATRIAPNSGPVLAATAFRHADLGQWADVERIFTRAGRYFSGSEIKTSGVYSDHLVKVGRANDALTWVETARRLEPLAPGFAMFLGHIYAMQGRLDEAMAELERGYELAHARPLVAVEGMVTALATDDPALQQKWIDRAVRHQQPGANAVNETMALLRHDRQSALHWLRNAFERSEVPDYYVTVWAAHLDDPHLALQAMQRTPDPWVFWSPLTAEVRSMSGFKDLVRETKMDAYWREFGWGDFCRPSGTSDFTCDNSAVVVQAEVATLQ
ncbi:MAG: winged helix-turn-helix domain-containing protein [Pseudomonadota bacterium]